MTEPARLLNRDSVLVPVAQLRPHPRNPNRNNVDDLAESMVTTGWWGTVTVQRSTNFVLAGNHRLLAARAAGLTEIPVSYVDVDDETALVILLADNRYAERAERDPHALRGLLEELDASRGLLGTGYDHADLVDLLASLGDEIVVPGLTDEDDVPEPSASPVTRPGDVWVLGRHRLACGDSTDPDHLARLMHGVQARLVCTDPPYNVNYEGKTRDRLKIANDAMSPAEFRAFLTRAMRAAFGVAAPGACVYVAYAETEVPAFRAAFDTAGWRYAQTLVWVKNAATLGRQDYNWRHEPLLYGWKPGAAHYFGRDFTQNTVIDEGRVDVRKMSKAELVEYCELLRARQPDTVLYEDKPVRNALHPTMKPVALIERLVVNSSRPLDPILDPFGGSGTALIACEKTLRRAYVSELDPKYCDVIVRRWQEYSGQQAVREADGAPFASVAA